MKHRKLIIRLILLAVVCIPAVFTLVGRHSSARTAPVEKLLAKLPHFEVKEASGIALSWRKVHTTLERTPEGWMIRERGTAADEEKVNSFLESLSRLRALRTVDTEDRSLIAKLRIGKSEKDPVPGVLVCVKDRKGKILLELAMGGGFFLRSNAEEVTQEALPDGRYFGIYMLNGKKMNADSSPVAVLSSSVFSSEHPVPGSWIRMPDLSGVIASNEMKFFIGKNALWHVKRDFPEQPFRDLSGAKLPVDMRLIESLYTMFAGRWLEDVILESVMTRFRSEGGFEAAGNGIVYSFEFSRFPGKNLRKSLLLRFQAKVLPGAPESAKKKAEKFNASVHGKLYLLGQNEFQKLCRMPFSVPRK